MSAVKKKHVLCNFPQNLVLGFELNNLNPKANALLYNTHVKRCAVMGFGKIEALMACCLDNNLSYIIAESFEVHQWFRAKDSVEQT